jgi:hypothetical protein
MVSLAMGAAIAETGGVSKSYSSQGIWLWGVSAVEHPRGYAGAGSLGGHRSGDHVLPSWFDSQPEAWWPWFMACYTSTGSLDLVYT